MLINLTNHPSTLWSREQTEAAAMYGEIRDLPFPTVSPSADEAALEAQIEAYDRMVADSGAAYVLLQGEYVFTFRLATRLKARGVRVFAAVSERCVTETQTDDGRTVKQSEYRFRQFREY